MNNRARASTTLRCPFASLPTVVYAEALRWSHMFSASAIARSAANQNGHRLVVLSIYNLRLLPFEVQFSLEQLIEEW